ncbi:MAG: T9SS type A sorting domain-containing protein [Candidatus Cloacimonetes bacterium]|nr:T9SS type A sorting domain-containing protein [Candidatus Cloacimonadota bacterium]
MTANIITYTKLRTNPSNPSSMYCEEIWEYRTDLGSNVTLQSMATAKAGLNRMLYAITDDGVLYGYAYVNSTSRSTECSQRSQTSRHTRCYEQPVPHVVNGTLFIKHPFVVDQCTSAISSNITINQGVLGRFEYNTGLSIARSELSLCGSEDNPVFLTSMSSKSKNYWKVIQVKNGSDLTMNWAKVSGAIQALDISNTGYRSIENCTFENNRQIVNCYNATVNMFNNFLTDAGYAISAYHFSSPMLNYTFSLQNGLNEISGNEYGIFSDSSTPHLKDGHNNLESSVYNLYLQNLILSSDPIYAQNNWWGYDDFSSIKLSIHPVEVVECVPYDDEPNRTIVREDTQINMFIEGYSNMINGDYRGAMNCFYNVLADSLINDHDITSLYSLFECHKKLSLLDQYEDYLNQSILESEYTPLHKVMKNVRALIYRETERYSQAIEHYETILLNSPSFQDSCYAVIDLGDTYLESNGGYRGQLTEYVPVNSDFHQQNRNLLLNSILKLHIGNAVEVSSPQLQLMGNYPNPFNPTTIIRFNLQSEAKVKIDIYNIKGQKVFTIVDEIRSAGLNSVLWNGRDYDNTPVSSGIYFYRVSCDGSSKVAKMMLIK